MRLFLAFTFAVSLTSVAVAAEKPVEIPLKEIWAEGIPGTRNVRELQYVPPTQTNAELLKRSLVEQIKLPLRRGLPPKSAGKGFAVSGNGLDALKAARDVLTGKGKRPAELSKDGAITLVFYSYSFGAYVRLDSIERSGHDVTIKWHFHTDATLISTAHFALIPLGKLAPGTYQVDLVELPLRTGDRAARSKAIEKNLSKRVVCRAFSFMVK